MRKRGKKTYQSPSFIKKFIIYQKVEGSEKDQPQRIEETKKGRGERGAGKSGETKDYVLLLLIETNRVY